jgi:transcriptional regulator with XRE-family HTH domain
MCEMVKAPVQLLTTLVERRAALGMSHAHLSVRSGVPIPTVKRILGGRLGEASFANVAAIAEALGSPIGGEAIDVEELRRRQARLRAEQVARLVQGTSALEAQAVGEAAYRTLVERSYHELLAGSPRRLWGD